MASNIYDYITEQEASYKASSVPITDGYSWSMYDHVKKTTLYKNSKYTTGADDGSRPYKNIIKPIAKLAYRSEGFDVKDIEIYIDNADEYYKSFLLKKFHDRWAIKKQIDSLIDQIVNTAFDYGGVLVKKTRDSVEVVNFQNLAFCDQTDIISGAIGELHEMTVEDLQEMRGIWNDDAIDMLISQSKDERGTTQANTKAKTPSKYCEVYEVRGMFPKTWMNDENAKAEDMEYLDEHEYERQVHIVAFGRGANLAEKKGINLFKAFDPEIRYKFMGRGGKAEKIPGRALNCGGYEELFEPQVWVNYSAIQLKEMLDVASLMIIQTSDTGYATKNNLKDLEQGEIMTHSPNEPATQLNFQVVNEAAFNNNIAAWEALAKTTGSASDPLLGITPSSGTPFALEQLKTQNALQEHEYQRGINATFVNELYMDWILPLVVKDVMKGDKWMDSLSLEEMQSVVENVIDNEYLGRFKKDLLKGKLHTPEEKESIKSFAKQVFMKDNRKFLEILKNEMRNLPMNVKVNVAGKQSYLAQMTDKLSNIFRQVIANPQILQIPQFAKIFNQILESSGISPVDFTTMVMPDQQTKPTTPEVAPTESAPVAA